MHRASRPEPHTELAPALDYIACELCGCLVGAAIAPAPGTSILCEGCLRTRRVRTDPGGPLPRPLRHRKHVHKFRCLHCGRKLRSKSVNRQVELTCPACQGLLILGPGGTVGPAFSSEISSDEKVPVAREHETHDPEDSED